MAAFAVVAGGVPALGVVAATDVAAALAHPQMNPLRPPRQALLAALDLGRQVEVLDRVDVGAIGRSPTLEHRQRPDLACSAHLQLSA